MQMNPTISDFCYHFTGWNQKTPAIAYSRLKSILRSKEFKFNRNERKWTIQGGYRPQTSSALSNFYVNMVCFTETPINYLRERIESKGGFSIGMKMEWILRNGGQNVIYVDNTHPNDFGRALTELLDRYKVPNVLDKATQELATIRSNIVHALIAATEDVGLRHEREWRIIRNELNTFLTEDYVKFDFSDIASVWCPPNYLAKIKADIDDVEGFEHLSTLIHSTEEL